MRNFLRNTTAAIMVQATLGPASGADTTEIQALREQLRVLEQKLLILERKQQLKEEAAAAAAPTPAITPNATGFSIASADGNHRLRLRGNAQADARFFLGDNSNGNDTFLIRRLRLSFEGNVGEKFSFRLMPDFAPGTFNLLEAYVAYQHNSALNVLFGKTKSPFDLERLVSQTDLLFIERSYPTSLGPNRDVGLQLFGEVAEGTLTYQVAWLNGARDNDTTIVDTDDGKEIVARAFAHPFKNRVGSPLHGLGLGIAVSTGDKSAGTPNGFRTNAQQTFFAWRPVVLNNGQQRRIEPQAYYYYGPFGLIGSWASSTQALFTGPGTPTRDIINRAWYVATSWVLTGEDAGYKGVTPATSFSLAGDTWGGFEVAVRYGEFKVDDTAFPVFANPTTAAHRAQGTTLGLNWYLSRSLKASFNFEHTGFAGGAGNAVTAEDERAIFTRLQVRY